MHRDPPPESDRSAWLKYWYERQGVLEGPQFAAQGTRLDPAEVRFVERMVSIGERLRWIPPGSNGSDAVGTLPTNDFVWLSRQAIEVEHKALLDTTPTDFKHMARQVAKATGKNARREIVRTVILDLGDRVTSADVLEQLARYNDRAERKVRALWIMSRDQLTKVQLR